jgi:hypothetical protein
MAVSRGHLPAVFRNEGNHEKIFRGLLAAITIALGTAGRTMEFDTDGGSFVAGGVPILPEHCDSLAGIINVNKLPVTWT